MDLFDDILNVYAYLFSKYKKIEETAEKQSDQAQSLHTSYQELNDQADELLAKMSEALGRAKAMVVDRGVDVSGLSDVPSSYELDLPEPVTVPDYTDIKIPLPLNFDYTSDFWRLLREARAAGFTNVHPEELLTEEEMAHARAFSNQLDEQFSAATQLRGKDLIVLSVAVAARVLFYFLVPKITEIIKQSKEMLEPPVQPLPVTQESAPAVAGTAPSTMPQSGQVPSVSGIDAVKGVDLSGMLKSLSAADLTPTGGLDIPMGKFGLFKGNGGVLDYQTILAMDAPFDIQETHLFRHDDIAAYNACLGWVLGTINILTDTVTTNNMKSYAITRSTQEFVKPYVDREISTVYHVLAPVLREVGSHKNSVIAAVMQEALVQGAGTATPQQVRTLFNRAMELDQKTYSLVEETKSTIADLNMKWADCIGDFAATTLINTIVSAVHAVMYTEADGSLDAYAVRTNKIILCSNAMATVINSIPAVASKNVQKLDFNGILTTCLSLFQSTKFWIEAKTAFLVSAYKEKLDVEMKKLDQYFTDQ